MHYVLLLYGRESWIDELSDEDRNRAPAALGRSTTRRCALPGWPSPATRFFDRTAAARTVRGRDKPMVTDGPFAETREQLGGFYRDRRRRACDEAVEWAERCPALVHGAVEIRPVLAM